MTDLLTDEEITDWLYNCLKEIEVEEGIKLSDRAFIADHLTPKVKAKLEDTIKQIVEWGDEDCFKHPYSSRAKGEAYNRKHHRCPECWQGLKGMVEK